MCVSRSAPTHRLLFSPSSEEIELAASWGRALINSLAFSPFLGDQEDEGEEREDGADDIESGSTGTAGGGQFERHRLRINNLVSVMSCRCSLSF